MADQIGRSIRLGPKRVKGQLADVYTEEKKAVSQPHDHVTEDDKGPDPESFGGFSFGDGSSGTFRPAQKPTSIAQEQKAGRSVPEMLRDAAAVYEQRNAVYGDNYKHFGKAMMGVFPNGLTVSDEDGWNKLGILIQVVSKVTRIGQTFPAIHKDSCVDASVYSMMLLELGEESE